MLKRFLPARLRHYKPGAFAGTWDDRLTGLLDSGVEFSGKAVLDIGSCVGIVAYEIAKHRPSKIVGLERDKRSVEAARQIFRAVPVQSRFHAADAGDANLIRRLLDGEKFGVVLLLGIYQHVHRQYGREGAAGMVKTVADHCSGDIITRTPITFEADLSADMALCGFAPISRHTNEAVSPLTVFGHS